MNWFDIQMLLAIKLILLIFITTGAWLIAMKKPAIWFLWLVGAASAGAYFFLVKNLQLSLFGLTGDELTLAAIYNTFAHISPWSDFAYHSLPPFYPPAWFWLFSLPGRLLNWNGVMMAKFAAAIFLLIFPAGFYYLCRALNRQKTWLAWLAPLLIFAVLDKSLLIGKPYEILAAAATILWYLNLHSRIAADKFGQRQILLYGFISGLLFMTYYLWLVFAALALLALGFLEPAGHHLKHFAQLIKTALVGIAVSLPFTLPLIFSGLKNGWQSWQTAFFTPDGLNLWLPMFQLNSFNALILLFGLAVLIYYKERPLIKSFGWLFLTTFAWWALGLISLLIFKTPFQEFRGFYILAPMILALAAAYGLENLWTYFKINERKNLALTLAVIGLLYFSSQAIFGFFVDDPKLQAYRQAAKNMDPAVAPLVAFVKTQSWPQNELTLATAPQLLAFAPLNNLIYFNQNNNHPSAIFSARFAYLQSLTQAQTAQELSDKIQACSYGPLKHFIFYKDKDNYYLYFHFSKLIKGIEEKTVSFNQRLFAAPYFQKIYDKDGYVVINAQ